MNQPLKPITSQLAAEVDQLSASLERGEISAEEHARLDAILLEHEGARQRYIMGLALIASLEWDFVNQVAVPEDSLGTPVSALPLSSSKTRFWLSRRAIFCLAACLVFALFAFQPWRASNDGRPLAVSPGAGGQLPVISSLKTTGTMTTMHLKDIGYVTIDGKAEFALVGPKRAKLSSGKMRMRVTEESGRGFVVETPDGDITDLGTEFGVHVTSGGNSALAVFEGSVDLLIAGQTAEVPHVERLLGGDGVLFNRKGQMDRLNSIMTGVGAKFEVCGGESSISFDDPLIIDTYDNLPASATKRYYEIVTKGMKEDSLAHVDRLEHNWNGLSSMAGMPKYLRDADYVKTFCDDKRRIDHDFKLTVILARPAKLYVLFDKRLNTPKWLSDSFHRTDDCLGLDAGKWSATDKKVGHLSQTGVGPGESIDIEFVVWERIVDKPGPVELGANGINRRNGAHTNMYGVVAVESAHKTVVGKKRPQKNNKVPSKKLAGDARTTVFSPISTAAQKDSLLSE